MRVKSIILMAGVMTLASCTSNKITEWPEVSIDAKPGSRWWWLGSALDSASVSQLMAQYAEAGLGTMEITPIYGVQDNDSNDIMFLSDQWMAMLGHVEAEAAKNGMLIDMSTGTGWPFGGPLVEPADAASKMYVETFHLSGGEKLGNPIVLNNNRQAETAKLLRVVAYSSDNKTVVNVTDNLEGDTEKMLNWTAPEGDWTIYAVYAGHTFQKVKRAAPGGEGLVIDHFSSTAVDKYLDRFTQAFKKSGTPVPHNFFNDSYEVYGADMTPDIFDEFAKRRGYSLEEHLLELMSTEYNDTIARVKSDYCETLSELLLENFTTRWSNWAHQMGSKTRNQAHGSPANLIDIYAAVDIPECEGFGLSDFGIKGLRKDSLTRKNDSDLSMLKWASSAAHISGKQLTSSETFTWLTEHFRTSLSQCKPDLDLFFVSGINHVYFHGTTYSPIEAEWPGWRFYASVDMSPANTMWRDIKSFNKYIERCQSFLQMGKPDNDFLVYLPIYDIWYNQGKSLLQLSIHDMAKLAPEFISTINTINASGYDVDYTSDKYLYEAEVSDGEIAMPSGVKYKALVIPAVHNMPVKLMEHIVDLASKGATVVFAGNYPESAPGLNNLTERNAELKSLVEKLPAVGDFAKTEVNTLESGRIVTGSDYADILRATGVKAEAMKSELGLHGIRRLNDYGYHYFVSNLSANDVDEDVELGVDAESAMFFDPMTGKKGRVAVNHVDGKSSIRLQLASGESIIIRTYNDEDIDDVELWSYRTSGVEEQVLEKNWTLSFVESTPEIKDVVELDSLKAWTSVDGEVYKINMGTALYKTTFKVSDRNHEYRLSLGDVRETARVRVNGKDVITLWAVPYTCELPKDILVEGDNTLELEVTGLPANRIAQMDRNGIVWRKFKEINVVDIKYSRNPYSNWETVECGLMGPVVVTKM